MSRASRILVALGVTLTASGCWEQVSVSWFAQMKDQPAVQALEDSAPLVPPDGTIPVGGIEPRIENLWAALEDPRAKELPNPIAASQGSVTHGAKLYQVYCTVCHGKTGMLDGATVGTRVGAIPLAGIGRLTDGQLFTKIRYGKPIMPAYPQIPAEDRWHLVNYLRTLIKGS